MARASIQSLVLCLFSVAIGTTAFATMVQPALAADIAQEKDVKAVKAFLARFKGKTWESGPTRITNKATQAAYPGLRFYYVFSSPAALRADKDKLSTVLQVDKRGQVGFFSWHEGLMKIGGVEDAKVAAAAIMSLNIGRNGPISVAADDVQVSRKDQTWDCKAVKKWQFFYLVFDENGKFANMCTVSKRPLQEIAESGKKVYYTVSKSKEGGAIVVFHNTKQGDVRCDEIPASKMARSGVTSRDTKVGVAVIFYRDGKITAVKLEQQPVPASPDAAPENKNNSIPEKPADAMRDAMTMLRFAPLWTPVPKFPPAPHFPPASNTEAPLSVPSFAYAMIWQPQWQEELGLSAEQKKTLLAINAKAVAEAKDHAEQFKKLSPEERQAQVKAWAGKSSPWRQQLDNEVRRQIEAVLTPKQLQTLRDFSFPGYAIGLLYDAKMRQEIGFSPKQEDGFRRIAKERLARFQKVYMERAEKLWGMLTPQQQAALPEVVKRQGSTSAVLSIAWELGFDLDNFLAHYPMLAEAPVRKRLGLSAEQEKQLHVVMAASAVRREKERQERLSKKTRPSQPSSDWEADAKKQVEAILTPQQLTTLNEINFRRQVALALGYPEKRKTVGVTAQQDTDFERLDKETHERLYRIDRKMLGQALEALTPHQREPLRKEIDRRGW